MSTIVLALKSVVGLFVDDEFLALGVLGVVALSVVLVDGLGTRPALAGGVLLGGNLLVLAAGAIRTARRAPRR